MRYALSLFAVLCLFSSAPLVAEDLSPDKILAEIRNIGVERGFIL